MDGITTQTHSHTYIIAKLYKTKYEKWTRINKNKHYWERKREKEIEVTRTKALCIWEKNKIYLKHMIIGSSNSALNVEKSGVEGRADLTKRSKRGFKTAR